MKPSSESSLAAVPTPPKAVHGFRGWRYAFLWPLGVLIRVWGMTLRFKMTPEVRAMYESQGRAIAFTLWHNRLFVTAEIFRRYRKGHPIYCLVSASKDGAWLDAFFSVCGMRTVRGSSSRLGREAATALVEVAKAGNDIGITPDGPRGPRYDFKGGALIVARRAKMRVLLLGARFEAAWQLKSWDRFYIPKPFSTVHISAEMVEPEGLEDREEATKALAARLLEMNPD